MAQAKEMMKNLKIKTGSVTRLLKDTAFSLKEIDRRMLTSRRQRLIRRRRTTAQAGGGPPGVRMGRTVPAAAEGVRCAEGIPRTHALDARPRCCEDAKLT